METVTRGSSITGTLHQTAEDRRDRATPNQSDLGSVFWNTALTSSVEARIGQGRGYLNAGRVANNPFAGDEISAGASNE
jgi:hypothetical protein